MEPFIRWTKITLISIVSIFLIILSIFNLGSAYQLKNPVEFVMTFFSQCLMLMIGMVGIIYAAIRLHPFFKKEQKDKNADE